MPNRPAGAHSNCNAVSLPGNIRKDFLHATWGRPRFEEHTGRMANPMGTLPHLFCRARPHQPSPPPAETRLQRTKLQNVATTGGKSENPGKLAHLFLHRINRKLSPFHSEILSQFTEVFTPEVITDQRISQRSTSVGFLGQPFGCHGNRLESITMRTGKTFPLLFHSQVQTPIVVLAPNVALNGGMPRITWTAAWVGQTAVFSRGNG